MVYLFPLVLCFHLISANLDLTATYYAQLIYEETTKAATFKLPSRNSEFRSGIESKAITDLPSYDFVIVGSGSAGSVLTTRLSEIDDFNILLLEAGGEENDFNQIPAMFFYHQFSELNWGYLTTPQKHCCQGMINKQCLIPRGKVIGGSRSINSMMYVRGNPQDYNNWAALGNPGWSYPEVLPYFIKSENSQIDGDHGYHGKGGLLNVAYADPASPVFSNFVKGASEINASLVDYNGRKQIGSNRLQFNIKHGRRQSTGTAFLDTARSRKNVKVITKALATRIIIDDCTKTAKGVEFVTNGRKFRVLARKEVIVSAGAINSPQLLMLSGIGPKNHLSHLGIDTIVDLPVGKNLIDHPLFPGLIVRTNFTARGENLETLISEYLKGFGGLTKSGGVDGLFFMHTGKGNPEVPTAQFMFEPPAGDDVSIYSRVLNSNDHINAKFLTQLNSTTDIMIFLTLLHGKSRGQITLKSTNPIDFPNIDLNILSNQDDVDTIIDSIGVVRKLIQTKAFQRIKATLVTIPICTDFKAFSRAYWECVIRQVTMTDYHPCGTTAMGWNSETSVVDKHLKVHGVDGLRVIDAGVMPSSVSGYLSAPTVMIAEKMSDEIKKEYGYFW